MTLTYTRKEFNGLLGERDRLREQNAELLEALEAMYQSPLEGGTTGPSGSVSWYRISDSVREQARAAIKKAGGSDGRN